MQDLRTYLERVKTSLPRQFFVVKDEVSLEYETTAYWQVLREHNPIILFEKIRGYEIPIVENVFGSVERMALALNTKREDFYNQFMERYSQKIEPISVSKASPVKENILLGEKCDLTRLPIPKHFMQDGGRYITSGVICTKDPETGIPNLSFARLQLKTSKKLGVSLHSRGHLWESFQKAKKKGVDLPVGIFIGAHPSLYIAASLRETDEYKTAGGLLGERIELIGCETVDVDVPAHAEIVIEGKIRHDLEEDEGPFSEFTGYLSGRSTRNVIEVSAITHRSSPIYLDIVPSNSTEHLLLGGLARHARTFQRVKSVFPQVKDINWPTWGSHFVAIMSIKDEPLGVSDLAARLLMSLDYYIKLLIVVDEDVDPWDEKESFWALVTRFQPLEDIEIVKRSMGHLLDPSVDPSGVTSKVIINATKRKWLSENKPAIPEDIIKKVLLKLGKNSLSDLDK